jgi:4-hydroxy-3-polyprenylbenzoate decarboxylase
VQGSQYGPQKSDSTMLIDATLKHPMRRSRCRSANTMEHRSGAVARARFSRAHAVSPWHGYTLGDWTDEWEKFARRTQQATGKRTGGYAEARADRGEAETP